MAGRWARSAEVWSVRLRAVHVHGTWNGFDVGAAVEAAPDDGAAVAVVTRATVRARAWRSFRAASPAVDEELHATQGLLAVVGVGEAPVARLGTFSLWRDVVAMHSFSYERPHHMDVVRRTATEGWYREELFGRFQPYVSTGSWDGRNPLAGTAAETGAADV